MYPQRLTLPLPSDTLPYTHQVAGHFKTKQSSFALLKSPDKPIIYKALQDDSRGSREILFYERLFNPDALEILRRLQSFVPAYYGVFQCQVTKTNYLCLSDVLSNFDEPNVCDVKLGTVGYSADATPDKKLFEDAKYAWRRTLGFVISGMQIYDPEKNTFINPSKEFLRSLDPDQVITHGVCNFLGLDRVRRVSLALGYLAKLQPLLDWLDSGGSQLVIFCRASLLLAHGNTSTPRETGPLSPTAGQEETAAGEVEVRLIDFANSFFLAPGDEELPYRDLVTGFRHGLVVLMDMLRRVVERGDQLSVSRSYDELVSLINKCAR